MDSIEIHEDDNICIKIYGDIPTIYISHYGKFTLDYLENNYMKKVVEGLMTIKSICSDKKIIMKAVIFDFSSLQYAPDNFITLFTDNIISNIKKTGAKYMINIKSNEAYANRINGEIRPIVLKKSIIPMALTNAQYALEWVKKL